MSADAAPLPARARSRVLRCAACGRAETRAADDLRRLARTAWPVCCGEPVPFLTEPVPDRRADRRRPVCRRVRADVRRGSQGVGPNLAVGLFDVSEGGARVRVKLPVAVGEEFEVTLWPRARLGPIGGPAVVRWCRPTRAGAFLAGVRFRRRLTADELRLVTDN